MSKKRKLQENENSLHQPLSKKQKIDSQNNNKKKKPKNTIFYWINKQLTGKRVLFRHQSDFQIGVFKKESKTHALLTSLDTEMELCIEWKFVYPIIDHKMNYTTLLNGDDNVNRYVTHSNQYHYMAIMSTKLNIDGTVEIKILQNKDQ
eukprot:157684_1